MTVAVQQEDLQLLTKTLQELFLAEVPSGGVFQVKCAVNNDGLMILIQHPMGLTVDTQLLFQVLEDTIRSVPTQGEQNVQCFLRVFGEKRPYTKRSLYINQRVEMDEINLYPTLQATALEESTDNSSSNRLIFPPFSLPISAASSLDETDSPSAQSIPAASSFDETDSPFARPFSAASFDEADSPFAQSTPEASSFDEADSPFARSFSAASFDETDSPFAQNVSATSFIDEADSSFARPTSAASSIDETGHEAPFDPFAGTPDLLISKRAKPIKPILLGAACVGIVVLAGGAYLLTSPCVISQCKEIQTAEQLKTESRRLMRHAKSEKELAAVQQQLEASSSDLEKIPSWSPQYQKAEELQASLSGSSEKIAQVVKALQAASLAMSKTKTPTNSLEELQARQKLWRRAIAPLEAIGSNSELYNLAQVKLLSYRVGLKTVNQQLLGAEKWLKKLNAAQAVANAAVQQETMIQSLRDLQKVQSTWQVAVNALNIIPQTSSVYQQAQTLLGEYKPKLAAARDRATKEQLAAKTYQQAISTANQAKAFEQKQQWQPAVLQWERALQSAKQISDDSFQYRLAQTLIEPYSAALKQAQAKLEMANSLQQTRTDLNKLCTNGMRICSFTIDNRGITVQLTREYDLARQSTSTSANANPPKSNVIADGNQHLQMLQQALGVISDNAQLSLSIYDSQGKPVYTRSLEG
ncbi:hypothetical protein BV372_08915 [Nostoc sp. T09]|uniref:hypothetical protein n=1 Tax=Nostoc sp. T09 TaxID=1932621 RepID=UPI000A39513D|nr:hypothetical protein [Nostoc sp. T09]OUL36010.1 hypothetical protein BV372_08915 [Nostoc sp. T09]